MHIKIGDKVRYPKGIKINLHNNFEVTEIKFLHGVERCRIVPTDISTSNVEWTEMPTSKLMLPFNTYEYGGPLGTGIRITNPYTKSTCGHPTFTQFKMEWENLLRTHEVGGGSFSEDKNGHCIWWAAIFAGLAESYDTGHRDFPLWIDEFLKRWQVRAVPRRLIEEDCYVWWPGHPGGGGQPKICFEKQILDHRCPTCQKVARNWDQDQAWLEFCSEECYNGWRGSPTLAARIGWYHKENDMGSKINTDSVEHVVAHGLAPTGALLGNLMSEVSKLEEANKTGYQELQRIKDQLIETGKAKSDMHKRAQKAEGALNKAEKQIVKLSGSLQKATELINRIQSERDTMRNLNLQLQHQLIEAQSPKAFMAKVETVKNHVEGKICGNRSASSFFCAKKEDHDGPCVPVGWLDDILSKYEHARSQAKFRLKMVDDICQRERKTNAAAKARIAELEVVAEILQQELKEPKEVETPALIAQAKWAAIRTGIRAGATFGSLYFLLQYLTG